MGFDFSRFIWYFARNSTRYEIFKPLSLFALAGAIFLTLRDLVTFSMSDNYPPVAIAFWGFASLTLGGVVSMPFFGSFCEFSINDILFVVASGFFGPVAYLALIYATRGGKFCSCCSFSLLEVTNCCLDRDRSF